MTGARTIRFFFDWGHRWPLWESGTDKYTMEPSDFGLSEELTKRLRRLYDFWSEHADPFDGWDSEENFQRFDSDRTEVIQLLRSELPDGISLSVE
ncbi:hypothetical protein [Leifsonia sp. PS1209]|uniref:hypothetical protein n=1 Tax=Leifsonia sp. PS1209 TaxID=2724914 RepID=UPI001442DBF5|nr:hypothetical protein [Leifsonia sp. PS1209]QJA00287.1 hypothetical protein HF024_18455 [Leifsonia sp. PS1209]